MWAAMGFADVAGTVKDTDGNPLQGCVITLLAPADTAFVASDLTDIAGRFNVEAPAGQYIVNATALGHKSETLYYTDNGELSIVLEGVASDLGEVTVTASAPGSLTRESNKYIYIPDALPGEVKTAKDVLKTVPLVTTTENDGLEVLGKGSSLLYINGKPPRMGQAAAFAMLQTVPPENIKRVEIITNPGNMVDSGFTGGIVNVIMSEPDQGLMGALNAMWRSSSNDAAGNVVYPTIFLGYAHGKFNASLMAGYHYCNVDEHTTSRYDYKNEGRYVENDTHRNTIGNSVNLGMTATYDFTRVSNLGISFAVSASDERGPTSSASIDSRDRKTTMFANSWREPFTRPYFSGMVFYTLQTDGCGSGIDLTAWYANNKTKRKTNYLENEALTGMEELETESESTLADFKYIHRFPQGGSLTSGLRFNYTRTDKTETRDGIPDSFLYDDYHGSVYADYSRSWSSLFSMSAGLSGEYAHAKGVQRVTDETFRRNNWILSPNASITFRLPKAAQSFSLEYQQYVHRPSVRDMNPFRIETSPTTYIAGNPSLKNSQSYSLSLRYSLLRKFHTVARFSKSDNLMSNYTFTDGDGKTATSIANLGNDRCFGFEAGFYDTFFNCMRVNLTLNAYYRNVHASINGSDVGYSGWNVRQSTNLTFLIAPWDASVSVWNVLWSPTKNITTRYGARELLNISVTKYLFNAMSLTFSVNNVTNYRSHISYSNPDYAYCIDQKNLGTSFELKLTYVFGKRSVNAIPERSSSVGGDIAPGVSR